MYKRIEELIEAEKWQEIRSLLEAELAKKPDDHWLLTRLSLTYYEQYDYHRSLQISEQALSLAPSCPLVLWDYAGALSMLGRCEEALQVYQQLIDRGVESIAHGECGEGIGRARGLVADSHYRAAKCYRELGQEEAALREFEEHLNMRGPGCFSIYPLKEVAKEFPHSRGSRAKKRSGAKHKKHSRE